MFFLRKMMMNKGTLTMEDFLKLLSKANADERQLLLNRLNEMYDTFLQQKENATSIYIPADRDF